MTRVMPDTTRTYVSWGVLQLSRKPTIVVAGTGAKFNGTPGQNAEWRFFHATPHNTQKMFLFFRKKYGNIIHAQLVYYLLST